MILKVPTHKMIFLIESSYLKFNFYHFFLIFIDLKVLLLFCLDFDIFGGEKL